MTSCRTSLALSLALAAAVACGDKKSETQPDDQRAKTKDAVDTSVDKPATKPAVVRVTGIPDENPTELARSYQPLVDYLTAALGTKVEYVPVTDYGAAVQALAAGKVDFAWLGGFTHVQARNLGDVVPLVQRDIDRKFHSVFIASTKSGVKSPADLKGKTFAFGSRSSTSGHLMPRHFLTTKHSINAASDFKGKPVYSGAHDATAKMVEQGKVDAGALNKQVWDRMVADKKIDTGKVSVIWETPPYVDYVWTARKAVDESIRKKFADAFLALSTETPEHGPILKRMGATNYVIASPTDFDAIESVGKETGLLK